MAPCSQFRSPGVVSGKGEKPMPTYRGYLINVDNRVASYRPLEAATDEEALETAKHLVDGHDVEVWLLDREVGRLRRN